MQGKTLKLINLEKLIFKGNKAKKNFISILKKEMQDLPKFEDMLTDSSEPNQWFRDNYLYAEFMQTLSENDRVNMFKAFNKLNPIQKRFMIHDLLVKQKEKYENMADDEISYEIIGRNLFNNFMLQVDKYSQL